ncbi:hypothetical protein HRE53_27590 (plasmid) [Acaryochloris sp. 'Moss Beach']|uniref:hypothetical protein n=1 Tax=Acaryochloris sp. 'Moss Beach' TaxID=2740837 RepID=UPI001F34E570|nr:hypothetical protein [Acaryochloris sp. 'Moss Beach']UJB72351.1 hypothetical protein HRE53_27590 [Acaryochloris sp. 'Moss Beach']
MVSTNPELGKPLGTDQGTQLYVQSSSPGINENCLDIYLQLAVIAQSFIPDITTLDTYEALYQLGCDDPQLSREIDEHIASRLKQSAYHPDDRFRCLFQGPYIQSQMLHHHLSKEGAEQIVRKLLEKPPVQRLFQPQTLPTTAA